jgi:hypothetical protein
MATLFRRRGNGDGTFEDVTAAAGILLPMINGQVSRSANKIRHMSTHTATWADFDLDG